MPCNDTEYWFHHKIIKCDLVWNQFLIFINLKKYALKLGQWQWCHHGYSSSYLRLGDWLCSLCRENKQTVFYTQICFCDKNVERSKPKELPVSQESPTESCHIIEQANGTAPGGILWWHQKSSLSFVSLSHFWIFAEMGLKNQGHRDTVYT